MENTAYIIDVKKLNKSFAGKPAVIDVSLQVKKGEIFGFLGPNGSGKTTTIRMLCGLLTPDSGEGSCLGYDVITEPHLIKKHVGYMAQKFSLYEDLSVYENLYFVAQLYAMQDKKQRVEQAIEQLGLTVRRNQLAGTLSGGWKQRLALSAALLHEPQLLLLDEPTAGVDPKARREFWDQVHEFSLKGITSLVSTHYMDEAERCTQLAYVMSGRIVTSGTPKEIVANSGLFTWRLIAHDQLQLIQRLRQLSSVEQVVAFGNALHVSGKNQRLLEQDINQLRNQLLEAEPILPDLEDIFINLVDKKADE